VNENGTQEPTHSEASSSRSGFGFLTLLLLAVIVFLGVAYWQLGQRLDALEAQLERLPAATIDAIIAFQNEGARPAQTGASSVLASARIGDPNAPLVMVEFSDFNCSFCGRYHTETFAQIRERFIDTGLVQYVYRDFIGVGGDVSLQTAAAARCLRDQAGDEAYFTLVSQLYRRSGVRSAESVRSLVAELGGDTEALATCIAQNTHIDAVIADTRAGQAAGIRGTPGFIIGQLQADGSVDGVLVAGAQPFEYFAAVLERQLAGE
jgi:protein-disulfide isomerase